MAFLWRYYGFSILFTIICMGLGAWLGWSQTGTILGTLAVVWIVFVLGILEVSLSFDNAVVNATVLKDMSEKWRQRFLTWGILIAVFGMRIVFPVAIVAIAACNANAAPTTRSRIALRSVDSATAMPRMTRMPATPIRIRCMIVPPGCGNRRGPPAATGQHTRGFPRGKRGLGHSFPARGGGAA